MSAASQEAAAPSEAVDRSMLARARDWMADNIRERDIEGATVLGYLALFLKASPAPVAAAPSEEPVAAFGEGKLVVDTGVAPPVSDRLYNADAPMADGEVPMTSAEAALSWLLIEKLGCSDGRSYTPSEASDIIVDELARLRDRPATYVDGYASGWDAGLAAKIVAPTEAGAPVAVSVKGLIERLRDVAGPVRLNNGCFADLAFEAAEALSSIIPATKGGEDALRRAWEYGRNSWCPAGIVKDKERTERDWREALAALSAQDTDGVAKL